MNPVNHGLVWSNEHNAILCITNVQENKAKKVGQEDEVTFDPAQCTAPTLDQLDATDLSEFETTEPQQELATEDLAQKENES